MNTWKTLTLTQFKLYLREPMAFFFTLIFPAMLLLLFGAMFGNQPDPFFNPDYGYVDYETPALIALILVTIGVMNIPIKISSEREHKVLRRYRATPLRPIVYLLADIAMNFLVALAGTGLLLVAGVLAFRLRLASDWPQVALAFSLTMLSFAALGYLIAALAPTARVAQVAGTVLFFPMMFLSGAAMPVEIMPEWLQKVSNALPMTHAVRLLQGLWFGEGWGGYLDEAAYLSGVLLVCTLIAARAFRWE